MKVPASCAVSVNVVSDIVPTEVPSKKTSVPAGTPVTFTTASSAGAVVLKVGVNVLFSTTPVASAFI